MKRTSLLNTTVSLALIGSASAGTIFTSVLDEETDVVNLGTTVVSAANFGRPEADPMATPRNSNVTVNGILHLLAASTEGAAAPNNADLISELTLNSNYNGDYRGANIYGLAGETMKDLMGGIAGNNSGLTLDISGLTPGQDYLFQAYWENEGNFASITFEGTDTLGGISGGVNTSPSAHPSGNDYGTLISYTFTADDSVLNVAFNNDGDDFLQGYSLQTAVPEPSTTGLLGLGGLALILRRRK